MKRTFRFTESQIKNILSKSINEDLNVAYQKPANGVASTTDMKQQVTNAKKMAPGAGKINLEVSSEDLGVNESKTYTKQQLKEAKLKMLKENTITYKKSDLFK